MTCAQLLRELHNLLPLRLKLLVVLGNLLGKELHVSLESLYSVGGTRLYGFYLLGKLQICYYLDIRFLSKLGVELLLFAWHETPPFYLLCFFESLIMLSMATYKPQRKTMANTIISGGLVCCLEDMADTITNPVPDKTRKISSFIRGWFIVYTLPYANLLITLLTKR